MPSEGVILVAVQPSVSAGMLLSALSAEVYDQPAALSHGNSIDAAARPPWPGRKCSTALVTNIMTLLDRLVDGALILKFRGKSYRAARAKKPPSTK